LPVLRHGDAFSPGAGIGTSAGDASRLCYLFFGTFSKTLDMLLYDLCFYMICRFVQIADLPICHADLPFDVTMQIANCRRGVNCNSG
ncbi:MAG: hypothetical protein LBT26_12010, partial [Clostridiales Family XIII bacterium]|nr:hypothetical protein [Clostridiales Family XIII bacterium]